MKKITCSINLLIPIIFLFLLQSAFAQLEKRAHTAYTRTIDYYLFTPENYSADESYPLILVLHGHGGGSDISAIGLQTWVQEETQQQHPSFIVFPHCPDIPDWWLELDIVNHLLVSLIDEFSIDTGRLYITGYSMGGFGTSDMIQTSPLHFAAAISVAGGSRYSEIWPLTSYIPPIWNFHGVNDAVVPVQYSREMIQALETVLDTVALYPVLKNGEPTGLTEQQLDSVLQAGYPLIYSETYDDHSSIDDATAYNDPRVKEWMFSHQTDFVLAQDPPMQTTDRVSILEHMGSDPVFIHGDPDTWEAFAVSEPCVILDNDTLKMWYAGWETAWVAPTHIGYAWSLDGISWHRYANNPVMTTSLPWEGERINHVSVTKDNDIYLMWYSAGDSANFSTAIGNAWSEDGLTWTKHPDAVLLPGTIEEWDHFNIAVGTVIKENDIYKMWYHGGTFRAGMKIGYATSADGISWTKYNDPQTEDMPYHISDPVISGGRFALDWDFHGAWYPMVYHDSEGYEMWYSGYTLGIVGFLHYAVSEDGIIWLKSKSNPVLSLPPDWAPKTGYVGGSVIKRNGKFDLWYSQYDYQTGESSIGYAIDFSNIAHTDSFRISSIYLEESLDSLEVNAWVTNPHEDNLEVLACILSEDSLIDQHLLLTDQGDNLWSGYGQFPQGERTYSIGIQTTNLDSGTFHNTLEREKKYFTTVGPLELADFEITSTDSTVNPGDRISFRFSIKNWGNVATAENIKAEITVLDTLAYFRRGGVLSFADIPAGSTVQSGNTIIIGFKKNLYPKNPYAVKFAVEIKSNERVFWCDTTSIIVSITDIKAGLAQSFFLGQNYPNPFNPTTVISYQLAMTSEVELSIYNILGQKVATLVNKKQAAGSYDVEWDAGSFASGVYYYRLSVVDSPGRTGAFIATKKLVLLK